MTPIERTFATYERRPVDHLIRREFYIWQEALDRWKREGMPADADLAELFVYDPPGAIHIGGLGWCEPAFVPGFWEEVLREEGDCEIIRDSAGRILRVYRGRRHGFMPTYLQHVVADDKDWEEIAAPRLSPETPERWDGFEQSLREWRKRQDDGWFITQSCIGGYMYLRSLVGPMEVCFMFVENPKLVHRMMAAWLSLADELTRRVQEKVEIDELFLGEDICYNHGLLISPAMVREFLLPYYQDLLRSIRSRQRRRLHFHIDSDGNVGEAIDLFMGIGMDVMSPFEVAAGNDLLDLAGKHPDLVMMGGIDKRVLAQGPKAIDAHLERILPPMVRRGGFVPTCDHGVPDNVSFESYSHYRKRILELDH